jgi:vacuole morphology and inheritance protein 14
MPSVQQAAGAGDGKLSDTWIELLPEILGGTLNCVHHSEEEISRMAVQLNNELLEMVQNLNNDFPVEELVERLLVSLQAKDQSMVVCTACLQWICMLLAQCPEKMLKAPTLQRLFVPIFETLLHRDDEVCLASLQVLAQIMQKNGSAISPEQGSSEEKDLFSEVTHRVLDLFRKDRSMLEERGRLMIRQLCGHLDPRKLYVTVAHAIKSENDLELAQQLVQTFSWILLTAKETKNLREELLLTPSLVVADTAALAQRKESGTDASRRDTGTDASLFLDLLEPWFHNPVSALALCLWASQYELATELTVRLAAFEPSIDLLRQLDQLVHLLESPIFSRLRLRLLEPQRHPALLKCLLSLAMLLPQAGAFKTLRERIQVVQSGLLLEGQRDTGGRDPGAQRNSWWSQNTKSGAGSPADLVTLLDQFDKVAEARQR